VTREARVLAVLGIGRRLRDASDPLGREAREGVEQLGVLSKEGVALAFDTSIETIEALRMKPLLARVAEAPRAWVVSSANVCTAAVRALALGAAAAPKVLVKPSRRDPVVARIVTRELPSIFEEVSRIEAKDGDAVHAYGADATLAEIASNLPSGVRFEGHGSGFGIAIIGADAKVDEAAEALSRDVVVFDQAGCLSPRICFVEGRPSRGLEVSEALDAALERAAERVPRGPVAPGDREALRLFQETARAIGARVASGTQHLVTCEDAPERIALGPALRTVQVVSYESAGEAAAAVAPLANYVASIGCAGASLFVEALEALLPKARRSALGAMQRPILDGPVDLRGARG
jgi:hypothetical protein